MHTSTQLFREGFRLEVDGVPADLDELFPGWDPHDRFGVVVSETLGALGASLVIQAAVSAFYETRAERRVSEPVYPEIYAFHAGGPHGDHNNFDFWPPRKEVFIPGSQPVGLLEAINSRAITRLALPDGPAGDLSRLETGPSTWAEQQSARERLRSCLVYSPSGTAAAADLRLTSVDPRAEENPASTLDPWGVVQNYLDLPHEEFMAHLPGPSVPADIYHWADSVKARLDETSAATREELGRQRQRQIDANGGLRVETYRRLSTEAALGLIAGMD